MLKVMSDTRAAMEKLHARDLARDTTLRDKLNTMAAQLEKGHGLLAAKGDTLRLSLDAAVVRLSQATGGGPPEPGAPSGLVSQQLHCLQSAVGGLVAPLQSAESKAETFEAAIKDAQTKIDRINATSRTVGARDPWQPRVEADTHATAQVGPEYHDISSDRPRLPGGDFRWKLHDERYLFQAGNTGKTSRDGY